MTEKTQNEIIHLVKHSTDALISNLQTNINTVYKQDLSKDDVSELIKYVINLSL